MANKVDLPVRPGDVIQVAEPDYCYGKGTLKLRITEILGIDRQSDGAWVSMYGVTVYPNGRESAVHPVSVRLSVLAAARRAAVL